MYKMNPMTQLRYQAGDILVASDNELQVPTGYLGHSAIAIDDSRMVEAIIDYPYLRMAPIHDFTSSHRKIAVYRPKDPQMGRDAAQYALWYLGQSEANHEKGLMVPEFSFSQQIPLSDPWSSTYCSKLIWLAYYYGAGYMFPNDFFLFSPEDIDSVLSQDSHFQLLYKHPQFQFVVNS